MFCGGTGRVEDKFRQGFMAHFRRTAQQSFLFSVARRPSRADFGDLCDGVAFTGIIDLGMNI